MIAEVFLDWLATKDFETIWLQDPEFKQQILDDWQEYKKQLLEGSGGK